MDKLITVVDKFGNKKEINAEIPEFIINQAGYTKLELKPLPEHIKEVITEESNEAIITPVIDTINNEESKPQKRKYGNKRDS